MSKPVTIKLTKASSKSGPFDVSDNFGNILGVDIPKMELVRGMGFIVDSDVTVIIITSKGKCKYTKTFPIGDIYMNQLTFSNYRRPLTACIWRHLTDIIEYNKFYGEVCPYIIEYPFAYKYQDEILQNVKDYTKAYTYLPIPDGVFSYNTKVETNDKWFNKAILYNGQQSTGTLELVPKPLNNLKEYMSYPLYNADSKTITFTKADNFYQYNTFWSLNKSSQVPLFTTSCESMSIDKVVNESNMDYGKRSFKKSPLRAKDLRVRHILDNRSDVHLVSQFTTSPSQISYR